MLIISTSAFTFLNAHPVCVAAIAILLLTHVMVLGVLWVHRHRRQKMERALHESEARFGDIANTATLMVWVTDATGRCVFVNKPWQEFTGGEQKEEPGQGWADRIHESDRRAVLESFEVATAAHEPWETEYRLRRHDGAYRWFLDRGIPRYGSSGEFLGMIGSRIDITDRKLVEEAIRDREARFHQLFENSIDGIVVADDTGRYVDVNAAACRIFEIPRESFLKMSVGELMATSRQAAEAQYREYLQVGSQTGEFTVTLSNGQLRTIEYAACRFAPGLHLSILRDVTERRATEAALWASEDLFRAIAEYSMIGIVQITPEGRVLYANPAAFRMYEVDDAAQLIGKPVESFLTPESRETVRAHHAMRSTGISSEYEVELVGARGTRRIVHITGTPIMTSGGMYNSMIGTMIDITERKRMEKALKEANDRLEHRVLERTSELQDSEERFQQLADATFEGIAIHDRGRILAVNQAMSDIFGYTRPELLELTGIELVVPGIRNETEATRNARASQGMTEVFESTGVRKDGSTFPVELRGKWIPYDGRVVRVTAVRDITDRMQHRKAEDRHRNELAHVMRQITLGELASGLAHELNQPLAAIANYSRACLRRLEQAAPDEETIQNALRQVAAQSERAGEIIRRMRTFVRKGEPQRVSMDLNQITREACRFVSLDFAESGVQVDYQLADEPVTVRADPVQIEQIILNFLRNAFDAVKEMDTKDRRVTIGTRTLDAKAEVWVSDTGPGVSESLLRRIFEPFATTKLDGMGLGLSISRGIAEAHGGRLTFENHPKGGATFLLSLPCEVLVHGETVQ